MSNPAICACGYDSFIHARRFLPRKALIDDLMDDRAHCVSQQNVSVSCDGMKCRELIGTSNAQKPNLWTHCCTVKCELGNGHSVTISGLWTHYRRGEPKKPPQNTGTVMEHVCLRELECIRILRDALRSFPKLNSRILCCVLGPHA